MALAMDRDAILTIKFKLQWRRIAVLCAFATSGLLLGCVTAKTVEMAWVRTDGKKITDDPTQLQQGKTAIAVCHADLDAGSPTETAGGCMAQKGYALIQKDQAEEVRAA
jgi:hypothetical protein